MKNQTLAHTKNLIEDRDKDLVNILAKLDGTPEILAGNEEFFAEVKRTRHVIGNTLAALEFLNTQFVDLVAMGKQLKVG